MRIREFTINRFGALGGQHVPRLSSGITVILGDNEAGKSTCLNFFRAMMFGYSRAHKNSEFLTDKNGSGSLVFETNEYGLLRLFRESGVRGGTPVLTNPDGSPRPDADITRILRGCSVDLYDRVFAFSLSELMQVSSLSDERIRHALHGAAFGTGLKSPGQVLRILDGEMDALFRPGGQKQKINALLRELDAVNAVVKERGDEVARYADLMAQLETAAGKVAASKAVRTRLEEERRALERAASLRQRWEELREAEIVLASLPEVHGAFTLDGRERIDRLAERLEDRSQALRAANMALDRANGEIASLAFDADLASSANTIFALAERKESVRFASGRIRALQAESDTLARSAESVFADLGPEWNTEKLFAADFSLAAFERCEKLGQAVTASETALSHARAEAERFAREKTAVMSVLEETRAAYREISGEGASFGDDFDYDKNGPENEEFERRTERLGELVTRAEDAAANAGALALAVRNAGQAYDAAIAAVDSGWTRDDFERVSLQPADRENALALALVATEHEYRLAEEEREYKTADRAYNDASFRVTDGEASLARRIAALSLPDATITDAKSVLDSRRVVLRRVQAEFKRFESASAAYAAVNEQFGDITNLVCVARPKSAFLWSLVVLFFAALSLVCGGGLYFFELGGTPEIQQYGLTALVCGGAFLTAWLVPFAKGGDGSSEAMERSRAVIEERLVKKREDAENDAKEAQEAIAALVADAPDMFPGGPVSGVITGAALAEAELALASQREAYVAAEREAESLHRENSALTAAARRMESAKASLSHVRELMERANGAWRVALTSHNLPEECPPADARFLLERLATASARRTAYSGRVADMENARERIGECLRAARLIPDLVGMLASLPEPDSHFAPDHGAWLTLVREYLASKKSTGRERVRLRDLAAMHASRLDEVSGKCAHAEAALSAAESSCHAAVAAWETWLLANSFAPTLSPETARRALDAASKAKTALENARRLEEQTTSLRAGQEAFLRDFAALERVVPESAPFANMPVDIALALLDSLVEKARESSEKAAVAATRERELPSLRDAVTLAEEHLAASREDMREILALAGCDTLETFRVSHGKWLEREAAFAAHRSIRVSLEREAADANLSLDELASSFADSSADALLLRLAELDAALGEAFTLEHSLAENKGKLDAAMSGLLSEKGLAELLAKRESITGEIESLANEWARLSAAKEFLLAAKGRFESERQDGVAKYAGDLFSEITEGAYSGISFSLDGEGILAVAKDGSVKDPQSELSRGTREQLYLALRLAYVINHGNEAEKLPVVMDDILVNFDAKRAGNTARALTSFASDHQMLFFTCHKQTADMLCGTSADVVRYTLEKGIFTLS
jgi:uncharacterized protein YhaN